MSGINSTPCIAAIVWLILFNFLLYVIDLHPG